MSSKLTLLCFASDFSGLLSTGFLVAAFSSLISLGVIVALIVFGVRRKKRWWWWVAWTLVISGLFFVISTYASEIMRQIVYPFLTWIGW